MVLVISVGGWLGVVRQRLSPTVSPVSLDSAVQLSATAVRTQQLSHGQETVLEVHAMSLVAESKVFRVHFQVEWMNWDSSKPVHTGDHVVLTGVLQRPPILSTKGAPIRAKLNQMGIRYELQGRVVQTAAAPPDMRQAVLKYISHALRQTGKISQTDNTLLLSIVFGDAGQSLDTQTKQRFLRAGLLHVLAASGANVFIMEWFFELLTWPVRHQRLVRVDRRALALLSLAFLWLFAWLCDLQPSIVRAVLMASYRSLGTAAGRVSSSWNGLLFAALVMTVVHPEILFTPSSVLSFAATAAVQTAMRSLYGGNRGFRQLSFSQRNIMVRVSMSMLMQAVNIAKVSVFVEVFLLPLLLYWFHQLTPFSVLSNLIAEPLLALLLPLTAFLILSAAADAASGVAALHFLVQTLSAAVTDVLHLLLSETQLVGAVPQALYTTSPLLFVDVLSYYVAIFGVVYLAKKVLKYANV